MRLTINRPRNTTSRRFTYGGETMLYTPTDLEIRIPTMRREPTRHKLGEHERVALELRRARHMQRWADRLDRLSRHLSQTANLRLARLR